MTPGPNTPDDDPQFYRGARDGEAAPSARRGRAARVEEFSDLDDRVVDLGEDDSQPFLRAQKRVPVRRGALPKKTANRIRLLLIVLVVLGAVGMISAMVYNYGTHSWRFRLESSDSIELVGAHHVTRAQVMQTMAADLSRNVFFIPLDERKKQLEEIPWVESATVMRLLPNRVKISIKERTPIAFAQIGSRIQLVDANGVLMSTPDAQVDYSFPVILGMGESDPLSVRSAQMRLYTRVLQELDGGGARYSQDVNEVDLSDPEDVKITVADSQGAVVIHLGASNFLDRYKVYVAHVQEWRQQYPKLNSVDLRYERQVIINPDLRGETLNSPAANAQAANGAAPAPAATPATNEAPAPQAAEARAEAAKERSAKPAHRKRGRKPSARHSAAQ